MPTTPGGSLLNPQKPQWVVDCSAARRLVVAGMLLTTQGDAGAQVFPADPPSDRVLEDVLVTAQKRTQLSQDVPMAISVLVGDAMEQAGVGDIFDAKLPRPASCLSTRHGASRRWVCR